MLQDYFTLMKITKIKEVDGAQKDTEYFWRWRTQGSPKVLRIKFLGVKLKKKNQAVKDFDMDNTRVSMFLKHINLLFLWNFLNVIPCKVQQIYKWLRMEPLQQNHASAVWYEMYVNGSKRVLLRVWWLFMLSGFVKLYAHLFQRDHKLKW